LLSNQPKIAKRPSSSLFFAESNQPQIAKRPSSSLFFAESNQPQIAKRPSLSLLFAQNSQPRIGKCLPLSAQPPSTISCERCCLCAAQPLFIPNSTAERHWGLQPDFSY
jgi:hypothetical protein